MPQGFEWLNFATQLGVAGPLVVLLIWLLRQTNEERREITDKYLATLLDTVKTHAESSGRLTTALSELSAAEKAEMHLHSEEHSRILQVLTKIEGTLDRLGK